MRGRAEPRRAKENTLRGLLLKALSSELWHCVFKECLRVVGQQNYFYLSYLEEKFLFSEE